MMIITITKKDDFKVFEALYWVCLPVQTKNDAKEYAKHFEVNLMDDGKLRLIGTDGSRLHWADLSVADNKYIEPGYYQLVKQAKSQVQLVKVNGDDFSYPDTSFLFSDMNEVNGPKYEGKLSVGRVEVVADDSKHGLIFKVARAMDFRGVDETCVNIDFLVDIVGRNGEVFFLQELWKPIYFQGDDIGAVIMPMSL
jgi:hypothetical protein